MKNAVAFMVWERLVPWKVLSLKEYPNRSLVPIGFGANSENFYRQLGKRSQIWVVTSISYKHSLAARITVQDMIGGENTSKDKWPFQIAKLLKQWKFVAVADLDASEFYETNNAAPVLTGNNIRFLQSNPIVYREESLVGIFKECMEQGCKTVVISYRWKEAKKFAMGLARELRKIGFSPWLDSLALPEYEADRESNKDAPRLNRLIKSGIERSKYAIVINTKTYGKSFWTQMEREHIAQKDIPTFEFNPKATQELNGKQKFYVKLPKEVLQSFVDWMTHNPNYT